MTLYGLLRNRCEPAVGVEVGHTSLILLLEAEAGDLKVEGKNGQLIRDTAQK